MAVRSSSSAARSHAGSVGLLERAPRFLRRSVLRVAGGRGLAGRVADALRFRPGPPDPAWVPATRPGAVRLVIGPVNEAAQGYLWAEAVRTHIAGATATSVRSIGPDPFEARVDHQVPLAAYRRSKVWQRDFEEYLADQTHVIWESGRELIGRRHPDVLGEIGAVRARGVSCALIFHGSDIRPPGLHADSDPWSPFRLGGGPVKTMAERVAENADLIAKAETPVFVSTPDLLRWVPGAVWCPVVVDVERWRAATPEEPRGARPVVVHAPSSSWLKGTHLVEPILWRLHAEGVIEYRQIMGVPHREMPEFYARADIVLDQFNMGSYGVAACEAMASGRLVMSHVDPYTREHVARETGLDLPIHEVTPDTVEQELRRAAAEPEAFRSYRERGPSFVRAVHDGRRSAAALAPFLGLNA